MRNDFDWEVFYKFRQVTFDISHSYVQWLLEFLEPFTGLKFLSREKILEFSHLFECIGAYGFSILRHTHGLTVG